MQGGPPAPPRDHGPDPLPGDAIATTRTSPALARGRSAALAAAAGAIALIGIAASSHPASALTIEEAIRQALERNERAAAADERAAAAQARVAKARSFFFPDLEFRGDYTRRPYETTRVVEGDEVTVQSRNALAGRATLSQVIFDARAFPAYKEAELGRDAARYDATDTKRRIAFETAQAFLATLGAEQVLAAAGQRLDLARSSLADARARFDAGLVGSNDVTRAELELATADREESRTRGLRDIAVLNLGFLIDEEIAEPLESPERLLADAAQNAWDAESLATAAAARRPDVLAARSRASALHSSAKQASLGIVPDLDFTGEYEVTNESGLSGRDRDWWLGLGLTWRPVDGGERNADHAERSRLASAADLEVGESERRVRLDVRSSLVALATEQHGIDQAGVTTEAAQRNVTETTELYRQGLARALEVVDANVSLFEADVDLARARFGLAVAFLELRLALGLDPLGAEVQP